MDEGAPPPLDPSSESEDTNSQGETPMSSPPPTSGWVSPGQGKLSEADDKQFSMLSHILGAFFSFIPSLILLLLKGEESPFLKDQSQEALNFQITIGIGMLALGIVSNVPFVACVGIPAMMALGVANLVFCILGGLEANKGTAYRYPYAVRLIK